MSKEDKHIDNLFKEKLDGRSFDGPPADFLADLNQRLDAKPAAPKGWIWMIFLNFFIIGLFIANASIDLSSSKTAEVESQIENKEQHTSKEESFKTENKQKKSTSVKANDAQTDNSTENESLNSTEIKSKGLENNQDDQNSTEANRVEKNQDNNKGTDSNTQGDTGRKSESAKTTKNKNREDSNTKNPSRNKNALADSKNKKVSSTSTDSRNKVSSQASKKVNDAGGNNSVSGQKEKSVAGDKATNANKDKTETENTTSNKEGVSINGTESISPYVNYNAIYAPEFKEIDRKIKTNDFPEFLNPWDELIAEDNNDASGETPQQEEEKEKLSFELQLQSGASRWGFKTLGTNDNYVNEIDQSGTPKWTPTVGLALHANFNRISVGTGVGYAKFKTENLFEFSEVSTYDSTYIAGYNQTYTYDSIGNIIDSTSTPYYDSTTVTDTTYNTTSITNEYEWIQIPLHIGYRFNLNKWAVIPRVGMNIGIGIRQSPGQYPNEAYDNLQTLSPVKWNLNLHTSLEVRREFGKWHAFGKFNYQRNLTPTIDNALFERKYNGIGFNFGVGYSF